MESNTRMPRRYSSFQQGGSQTSPLAAIGNLFGYRQDATASSKTLDGLLGSSSSGYGHTKSCGISLALLVTALAGIATMAYTLYTKITKGRRKRSVSSLGFYFMSEWNDILIHVEEYIVGGMVIHGNDNCMPKPNMHGVRSWHE